MHIAQSIFEEGSRICWDFKKPKQTKQTPKNPTETTSLPVPPQTNEFLKFDTHTPSTSIIHKNWVRGRHNHDEKLSTFQKFWHKRSLDGLHFDTVDLGLIS